MTLENEFGCADVPSEALRHDHVPDPDGDFEAILVFALTFDGYAHWGSTRACRQAAALATELWIAAKAPPLDLDSLRNLLFVAQRTFHHTMQPLVIDGRLHPNARDHLDAEGWLRDLTRAIRDVVPDQ